MSSKFLREVSDEFQSFALSKLQILFDEKILNIEPKKAYEIFLSHMINEEWKRSRIVLPFCGKINNDACYAMRKNHGLYTQCTNDFNTGKDHYCSVCYNAALNNSNDKPPHGDIRERDKLIEDKKLEGLIPYANIMKKLNISKSKAIKEAERLGLTIPEKEFIEIVKKRGRPKSKKVINSSVYDTDSDGEEKRGRGRPKKIVKKVVLIDQDLYDDMASEMY